MCHSWAKVICIFFQQFSSFMQLNKKEIYVAGPGFLGGGGEVGWRGVSAIQHIMY